MTKEKIDRISELTRISRVRELTEEEKKERQALRDEYRAAIRANLTGTLERVEFVDKK